LGGLGSPIQNAEDVVLAHDDVLRTRHFGLGTGILPKKDAVADFDIKGNQ